MSTRKQEIAKAFIEAKRYLRPVAYYASIPTEQLRQNTFICHAIDDARGHTKITHRQAQMAIKVIQTRLSDEHSTVEGFLCSTIGRNAVRKAVRMDPNCIQKYRHRWLDALIEEFSK